MESTEFQKRVLMTGLIISRSKKSGMLVEREVAIDILNFYLEMMYDAEEKGELIR